MSGSSAAARRNKGRKFYGFQAGVAAVLLWIFRRLPVAWASALGGGLARMLGGFMSANRVMNANLARILPELSPRRRREIAADVWDNLGRVIGELAHLGSPALAGRITEKNGEIFDAIRRDGKPAIFISAHYGNWELATWMANRHGIPLTLVYRAANNPLVEKMIQACRADMKVTPHPHTPPMAENRYFPKGKRALLGLMQALERGESIGMLIDQKFSAGMELPFFGHPAMTATTAVELAYRYDAPLVPFRAVRTAGCRFVAEVMPPIPLPRKKNGAPDVPAAMGAIHALLEGWIREHPGQWLWTHRRWKP